jgi:hypothetical protein
MALLPNVTGVIDNVTNTVIPQDLGTWNNLTAANVATWGDLTSWITNPANPMVWLSDSIDLINPTYFTLNITTQAVGSVGYTVYTSTDGAFSNATTTATTISSGDTNIPAFYGRYLAVAAEVTNTGGLHSLQSMELAASTTRYDILLNDIDSSLLSGTQDKKALPINRSISKVLNVQLTAVLNEEGVNSNVYVASGYVDSDYFLESVSLKGIIPHIVDKNGTGANVAFIDNEGNFTDCVFDAQIYVYPEQYMDGINLTVR